MFQIPVANVATGILNIHIQTINVTPLSGGTQTTLFMQLTQSYTAYQS